MDSSLYASVASLGLLSQGFFSGRPSHSLPLETASSRPSSPPSLSLDLPVSTVSSLPPSTFLALSSCCGEGMDLDRAGHWEVAACIHWGHLKSHLPSPASLWVALEEKPEVGSTGLCSTIKQSGQTFCDPGFNKFLSQSLERGCM